MILGEPCIGPLLALEHSRAAYEMLVGLSHYGVERDLCFISHGGIISFSEKGRIECRTLVGLFGDKCCYCWSALLTAISLTFAG